MSKGLNLFFFFFCSLHRCLYKVLVYLGVQGGRNVSDGGAQAPSGFAPVNEVPTLPASIL